MSYESISHKVSTMRKEEEEELQFEVTNDGNRSDNKDDENSNARNGNTTSFRRTFFYSRWAVLAACMAVAYGAGSAYDYGLYSDIIEKKLDYN